MQVLLSLNAQIGILNRIDELQGMNLTPATHEKQIAATVNQSFNIILIRKMLSKG